MRKLTLKQVATWTITQLKNYIQTAGKRAAQRIRQLGKSIASGKLKGHQSYIYDMYKGYSSKTKGLSKYALMQSAIDASAILSAKTSTVKGTLEWERKKRESLIKKYPQLGNLDDRQLTAALNIMGRLQSASRESRLNYRAEENLFSAMRGVEEMTPDDVEKAASGNLDDLLFTDTGELKDQWLDFAEANPADFADFINL